MANRSETGFDWKVLDALLQRSSTAIDCAAIMDCSVDTIERAVKEKYGIKFKEYRDKKMAHTRTRLIETALTKAFKGENVMLIFCLKNLCGWKDKQELTGVDDSPLTVTYVPKSKREP